MLICNKIPKLTRKIKERFWMKVTVTSPIECWLWTGCLDSYGYGLFGINKKLYKSNRVSYQLHFGALSTKMYVLHKCDTPACVNPNHLFLGTQKDNVKDMMIKNRGNRAKGEAVNTCKLNKYQVLKIKKLFKSGISGYKLARLYKVSHPAIYAILRNRSWKHLS